MYKTENQEFIISDILEYYTVNLGVPARKLAVGLSAHSPRHTSQSSHACGLSATIPNATQLPTEIVKKDNLGKKKLYAAICHIVQCESKLLYFNSKYEKSLL